MRELFRTIIFKCSHHERRKQELHSFLQEMQYLKQVDKEELNAEYAEAQARCEYKACKLLVMVCFLFILFDVWRTIIPELLKTYSYAQSSGTDDVRFWGCVVLFMFLPLLATVSYVYDLIKIVNQIRNSLWRFAMVEEVIAENDKVDTQEETI